MEPTLVGHNRAYSLREVAPLATDCAKETREALGDQAQGGVHDHRDGALGGAQGREPGDLSSGGALASRDGKGTSTHPSPVTQQKRTIATRQGSGTVEARKKYYAMEHAARCAWLKGQRMAVKWHLRGQLRRTIKEPDPKDNGELNRHPTWGGVRGNLTPPS